LAVAVWPAVFAGGNGMHELFDVGAGDCSNLVGAEQRFDVTQNPSDVGI
jgi:hypothetical protein